MANKDKLYNLMYAYCKEHNLWDKSYSIKSWNEFLNTTFAPATFTALVNDGKINRYDSWNGKGAKVYLVVPVGEDKKAIEALAVEKEKEWAENVIADYDKDLKRITKEYETAISNAETLYTTHLEWLNKSLEKAKAILG